jgi:hypothetical protein
MLAKKQRDFCSADPNAAIFKGALAETEMTP